jgi:predicted transcriptional regulator of viral defense system
MSYLEFKKRMFELVCFNTHQVYAWDPGFDRNNFVRWTKKGLLVRLRKGYYTFPEYKGNPDLTLYFANRIYRPSYISLHTAMAFYGMIPEAVVQITSVTSLKTISFINKIAEYDYKSVQGKLMFGYEKKPLTGGQTLLLAEPEKALLDLLYLYPFYNSENEMEGLRFDEDFLHDELNVPKMEAYVLKFENSALENRVKLLKNTYQL